MVFKLQRGNDFVTDSDPGKNNCHPTLKGRHKYEAELQDQPQADDVDEEERDDPLDWELGAVAGQCISPELCLADKIKMHLKQQKKKKKKKKKSSKSLSMRIMKMFYILTSIPSPWHVF